MWRRTGNKDAGKFPPPEESGNPDSHRFTEVWRLRDVFKALHDVGWMHGRFQRCRVGCSILLWDFELSGRTMYVLRRVLGGSHRRKVSTLSSIRLSPNTLPSKVEQGPFPGAWPVRGASHRDRLANGKRCVGLQRHLQLGLAHSLYYDLRLTCHVESLALCSNLLHGPFNWCASR